jgi:hypothetical protein
MNKLLQIIKDAFDPKPPKPPQSWIRNLDAPGTKKQKPKQKRKKAKA